jgi:hypothetical protein
MANFVQNLCHGYRLSDERTLKKVLDAITEAQLRCQMGLISGAHKAPAKNGPAFGIQLDLWTKRKLRDALMSLRLTFVTEDLVTQVRTYHDMLLKFGQFEKLRHTGRAIAMWVLAAPLADVGLRPTDLTPGCPDGASNGLKALRQMHITYDPCVEHQLDRAVKHSTGEASTDGEENLECYALIMANRKMAAKVLSSTQLQEGLKRLQVKAGIRANEALVVTKYGETRWASGFHLIAKNNDLRQMLARLSVEMTQVDPDLVAFYRDQRRTNSMVPDLDGDDADGDLSEGEDEVDEADKEDDDLRKLTMAQCVLTDAAWRDNEVYEGIYDPLREAMTRLQKSKVNTTSQVIPTMAKLRRYLEGDVFMIPQRPRSYKDVRNGEYPMVPLARADLPDWAKKCVKILVEQIDARFLKRKMSKWIYIATVMDPRNVLTKCFRDGDAVSVADATKMYRTELKDIARRHDVTRLDKPVVKPPAVKPRASGGSGKAKMRHQLKTAHTAQKHNHTASEIARCANTHSNNGGLYARRGYDVCCDGQAGKRECRKELSAIQSRWSLEEYMLCVWAAGSWLFEYE